MQHGLPRGRVSVLCVVVVVRPMRIAVPGGRVEGRIAREYAESGSRRYRSRVHRTAISQSFVRSVRICARFFVSLFFVWYW